MRWFDLNQRLISGCHVQAGTMGAFGRDMREWGFPWRQCDGSGPTPAVLPSRPRIGLTIFKLRTHSIVATLLSLRWICSISLINCPPMFEKPRCTSSIGLSGPQHYQCQSQPRVRQPPRQSMLQDSSQLFVQVISKYVPFTAAGLGSKVNDLARRTSSVNSKQQGLDMHVCFTHIVRGVRISTSP